MRKTKQYLALVRHGESFANVCTGQPTDALYYSICGSDKRVGITPRGRKQVAYSGTLLARMFPSDNPIEAISVSEFARVHKSAVVIAGKLGYGTSIVCDPRLNKRSYGRFWNLTYRGIRELFPREAKLYEELGPIKYRPPEGENYNDLFGRVKESFDVVSGRSGNQVVVGHLAVILAIRRIIEGLSDAEVVRQYETVSIPNGFILLYEREPNESQWRRVFVSDHLN